MDPQSLMKPEVVSPAEQPALDLRHVLGSGSYSPAPAPHEYSLTDYWLVLKKHRWTIVTSVVVLVSLAALISFRSTPLYEARSRLVINREASDLLGFRDVAASTTEDWNYTVAIDTQVKVLQSDTLASEVIRRLELAKNPQFIGDLTLEDDHDGAVQLKRKDKLEEVLLGIFRRGLSVISLPNSRIVEIRYLSPDPSLAAEIANTLAQSYIEHNFKTKFESTMQTSDWLSKQLADLQLKVETSQEKLVLYQREHGIIGLDEKDNIITAKLDELNKELTAAQADRIQKEAKHKLAASGEADQISGGEPSKVLEGLRAREADLRLQYSLLTTQFGPEYPKVLEVSNQLRQAEDSIRSEVQKIANRIENEYLAAIHRERMLHDALENQKQEANRLNESAIQYNILKRDVETSRQLYEGLLQRLKEAGVSAGLRSSNVRVVDPARVPVEPAEPNIPRNIALGLLLGLTGGIALAFVQELLDNTVRTPEQVELISALPSLGIIPIHADSLKWQNGRMRRLALPSGTGNHAPPRVRGLMEIISHSQPKSQIAESYRALRTSILLSSLGTPPKVILVTSALPQEGKTTTSINSAIVLAQKHGRVLLVDADLRRPGVHQSLGLKPHAGLSNLLAGSDTEADVILPWPQLPNLHVLPAGPSPPQPAELLGSTLMRSYLQSWRQKYDHIIIDTPPTLSVTDAVLLSVEADAVILVIRSGQTTKDALRRARDLLTQVNARVMGVVVNAIYLRSPDSYYYYVSKHGPY
ncbi:MAG: GumC family protein [Terriglobales bacterium]